MSAIKVIIRPFLMLIGAFIVAIVSYISAQIGERVVAYSHYRISTRNQRKRRIPIGFVKPQ